MGPEAQILPLDGGSSVALGGKGAGLARLISLGFRVPPAFAVVGARSGALPEGLLEAWRDLGGGAVAVRSSALDEDGADSSFAGQYATVLDVSDADALVQAVETCLASAESAVAQAYRRSRDDEPPPATAMCVVVQNMVQARAAGVCFTADPFSSRRDVLVIDSVVGLGEKLVSGEASGDHDVLIREKGEWQTTEEQSHILTRKERDLIAQGALEAESGMGHPLDLEWAIDQSGTLYWLQARPITTLGADPRELDTLLPEPDDVWTRCNVGEMMPGAVSPLTFSTCARGIEMGWQDNAIAIGVQDRRIEQQSYVVMFLGHLFINLSEGARFSAGVTGASADQQSLAICGRIVPEVTSPPAAPWRKRIPRIMKQVRQVLRAKRNIRRLESLAQGPFGRGREAKETWKEINSRLEELYEAYALHLQVSSGAGAMAPILLGMLAGKNAEPSQADHARVADLLAGARDVESADIVAGLERLAELVVASPAALRHFSEEDSEALCLWLEEEESGEIGHAYRRYLAKHGHRSVRELDVRQPEWAKHPLPVVQALTHQVQLRERNRSVGRRESSSDNAHASSAKPGRIISWLTPFAHRAVRNRERAKSLLVAITVRFKKAYRDLADQLVEEGRLPDADAVFFLLHEELGELCEQEPGGSLLPGRAVSRREAMAYQETLEFSDVGQGIPEPISLEPSVTAHDESVILGKPVSRGRAEGRARVVHSLEEAHAIEPGEILVARITDVGWTPFFGVVAGLVTDLGSAVSHGAVVAREYGLPAVLNTRVGTQRLETGDLIRVDGDQGRVDILEARRAIEREG